jgi:hypothetical protein
LQKPVGNAIGVLRTHRGEGTKNHEIESALQNLCGHFLHLVI